MATAVPNSTPRAARFAQSMNESRPVAAPTQAEQPNIVRASQQPANVEVAPQPVNYAAPRVTNAPNGGKFTDHAFPVIAQEPGLSDENRADIWSLFHTAKDTTELAQHLSSLPLHPMMKADLLKA